MTDCDIPRTKLCCHYWRKYGREGCRYKMSHNVDCVLVVEAPLFQASGGKD